MEFTFLIIYLYPLVNIIHLIIISISQFKTKMTWNKFHPYPIIILGSRGVTENTHTHTQHKLSVTKLWPMFLPIKAHRNGLIINLLQNQSLFLKESIFRIESVYESFQSRTLALKYPHPNHLYIKAKKYSNTVFLQF